MTQQLSQIQQILLETYKSFKEFCDSNGIRFFAAYGTMLGAVRHQGFIPWDDDIDVFMLRPEYNKFLALRDQLAATSKYKIADYNDKGYPYGFAKFYDTTKTFWEYRQFPFVIGPFIDVFPLDNWDADSKEMDEFFDYQHGMYWNYRKSVSYQPWREIFSDIIHLNGMEGPIKIVKKLVYAPQRKRFLRKLKAIDRKWLEFDGPSYICNVFLKARKYDKSWFESTIEMPFEDTTIYMPSGYDPCLRASYRDYKTLPPPDKRTGGHHAYYLNLERHLTIDEILKEKSDELEPRKRMSLAVIWDEIKHRKGF